VRKIVHRHLGKVVAGAAIAVAGTAVMIGVTLPGSAGAEESGGTSGSGGSGGAAQQAAPDGQGGAGRAGGVERAPGGGKKGKGRDPLTDDEMRRAERIAVNRQLFNSSENVEGARGPQRLGVDLAEPETADLDNPDAPRRADITFYDYKDDTLVTKTVNLETGKVEATNTQRDTQPPISRDEAVEATKTLLADPLGAGLKSDYKDATGKELTTPDQLVVNSMVFRVSEGTTGPAGLTECGKHRCVRLFVKVKNGPWIDTRNTVVDLSARKVAKIR